jgi:asparagine synthase (glutamine-hydrolysing)
MFLLSQLVRDSGYKVVLTGEGADEFFAGYDIFKEMQLRRFWARNPESSIRPMLFKRIYKDIEGFSTAPIEYLKAFFKKGLMETDSPYYSHTLRWNNTARNTRFLRDTDQIIQTPFDAFPINFFQWSHLAKAQFLEISTFLSPYLLSSQGDRMAMGNSVEERQPYLDYRLVEFCNHLPDTVKLRGLKEKWILKRLGAKLLPASIWKKGKKPYRAPINQCFFTKPPDYVKELLSEKSIHENDYFNSKAVMAMIQKASSSSKLGEVDSMAVAGIISIQLMHQLFIKDFQLKPMNSPVIKFIER